MKKIMVLLVIVAMTGLSHAGIVNGDSVAVDFNTAGDVDDFTALRDLPADTSSLGIAQNAAKGTGATASGGIEAVGVGTGNTYNNMAVIYTPGGEAGGTIGLGVGETVTLSLKFKVADSTSGATPRLGVASATDLATSTANWTTTDFSDAKDSIGGNAANGIATNLVAAAGNNIKFSIVDCGGAGAAVKNYHKTDGSNTLFEVANDNWYQFVLEITKSAIAGEFDITSTLNDFGTDGTSLASELYTMDATFNNAALYGADLMAGFTFVHNGTPATVSNDYDDFAVAVTPEPATMLMLGLGAILVRRKK